MNLVLVSVDTLRADHLPPYGYDDLQTPNISRLAREGVVFRQTYTPVPLTLPAHGSLFTGLLPFSHGVRDNGNMAFHSGAETLAEVFKARGYSTGGFVSAFVLDSIWGLDQGFDQYSDDFEVGVRDLATMARVQRPAGATWLAAQRWLSSHATQPFFLWIHFFDPHAPYDPPEPFATRHASHPYDGEIAYVDSVLGEILTDLESRSLLESTVVMLVSDHGEGLGQHGEDEHGLLTYDSTIRVPWIVRLPKRLNAGMAIDQAVSLVDVFPTVLDLFGWPRPQAIDGASRSDALLDESDAGSSATSEVIYSESLYPRLRFGWSELQSVRTERFKYTRAPKRELVDYRRDPGELHNLIDEYPDVANGLDGMLTAMLQTASATELQPASSLDAEAARRLQALGYVGNSPPVDMTRTTELPDPRDKIGAHRTLTSARRLLEAGSDAGVELLETLLAEEPGFDAAHRTLREHWIAQDEFARASAKYLAEVQRTPNSEHWLMDLGITYQAWEQHDEALDAFGRVLAVSPSHVAALIGMAEVRQQQGAHSDAIDYFTRALKAAPTSKELPVRLAQAYAQVGSLEQSVSIVSQALSEHTRLPGAHYLLAQVAEQRNDSATAEREYRSEVDVSPWDYRARFNLALLLGRRRAVEEQILILQSIPPLAPQFHEVHFYLAKALLETGDRARLKDALDEATLGLELAPESMSAPLGHYVRADVYALQGNRTEASRERMRADQLAQRLSALTVP